MINPSVYASFLDAAYLKTFVQHGGSAVKFAVPRTPEDHQAFAADVHARAAANGFVTAVVRAADTKIHLCDQVFFQIARQIDWDELANRTVRRAYQAAAFPASGPDLSVSAVAHQHGVDVGELTRDVNRRLQQLVQRDYAMVHEFRTAALRLCQAKLQSGQVTPAEHEAVLGWLTGTIKQLAPLRSLAIYRRVGKDNARQLLFSLTHWLSRNDYRGLFLELDITRLGFARRPSPDERQGVYYTKGTLLDGYELLRQFVDNADELTHCCIVVVAAPEFLTDQVRGVGAYQALKLRIHDEVRDRKRDNPHAALVRLGQEVSA